MKIPSATPLLIVCWLTLLLWGCSPGADPAQAEAVDAFPPVFPDYTFVTVPRSIAPLNMVVDDPSYEAVRICFDSGTQVLTATGKSVVRIPGKRWKTLLRTAKTLTVTVYALKETQWVVFKPFEIYLSDDALDYGLVYRRIAPGYSGYSKMGIYQRTLSDFRERLLIDNTFYAGSCVNCHSFSQTNPQFMQLHVRGKQGATLIQDGMNTQWIDLKNPMTKSCTYPYWHPDGRYIAYSVNDIRQTFHNASDALLDVYDLESDVVVYDVQTRSLLLAPLLGSPDCFETYPVFSPAGDRLYFCSAPARTMNYSADLQEVKYRLYSIAFDPQTGRFGSEIRFECGDDSTSISFPRPSYDGSCIVYARARYGNFSIWRPEADLWAYYPATGEARPLDEINSPQTESYHSWSSNSKWMVFSSRRIDGLHTRPYFTHANADGTFSKPFLLPQQDPHYYDRLMQSYNIPEFVSGPVDFDARVIQEAPTGITVHQ